jgi:predicted  nucleic acid-binding Zn-ribbon protein
MQAQCKKCRKVFETKSEKHVFCCKQCGKIAALRRKNGTPETDAIITCHYCNETIVAKRAKPATCGKPACVKRHKKLLKNKLNRQYHANGHMKAWAEARRPKKIQHPMGKQWTDVSWNRHVKIIRKRELKYNLHLLNLAIAKIKRDARITYGFPCRKCGDHIPPGVNLNKPFWDWCKGCSDKARLVDNKKNNSRRGLEWRRKKRTSDPVWTMRTRIMGRMHKALKRCGLLGFKGQTLAPYLGCTYRQATDYIEAQFKPRMTWKNYGTAWHVDHAIPLAAHDLSTEEGRNKAFHYTNLQPMWARDNIRKSDTIPSNGHQPLLMLNTSREATACQA